MQTRVIIRANRYHDSVSLMAISQQVQALPGVQAAVVAMGTAMNKELLAGVGLLTPEASAAGPDDLILALGAESRCAADAALAEAERLLGQRGRTSTGSLRGDAPAPRTVRAATVADPELKLALISVPGPFAAREARCALEQGLDVMLYSDNVPLEAEVALKRLALAKGRLLMGPDCGTAIIDGVGLGFANAVARGPVGIVAASGTGAQEVSCLIDRLGSGISQLIGVGGRDLSDAVGGLMMLEGLRRLQADPATKVIVLISKPPAPAVAGRVLAAVREGRKPAVVCFLGGPGAPSLDEAALQAVALATGQPASLPQAAAALNLTPGRRWVRGLFAGGTLCDQALAILEQALGPVACNIHPVPERRQGAGHRLTDLGDDLFTRGRPHPMIDMTLRRLRLLEEAADPEVAAILLDIVLGYGAHSDPAGALADAIREAGAHGVAVVASVTGTAADPQGYDHQVRRLQAAGAHVFPTARLAALAVAQAVQRLEGRGQA